MNQFWEMSVEQLELEINRIYDIIVEDRNMPTEKWRVHVRYIDFLRQMRSFKVGEK